MQQGKLRSVCHPIKNGQTCKTPGNTTHMRRENTQNNKNRPTMTQIIELLSGQKNIVTKWHVVYLFKKVIRKKEKKLSMLSGVIQEIKKTKNKR